MRALLLFAAVALVWLVIGVDPPYAQTFTTQFPANPGADEGTVDLAALPVRLHDFTGIVAAIEIAESNGVGGAPWIEAEPVDGQPGGVRIEWMGGACAGTARFILSSDGVAHRLSLVEQPALSMFIGCPSIGIYRSVVIRFATPVAPHDMQLDYDM